MAETRHYHVNNPDGTSVAYHLAESDADLDAAQLTNAMCEDDDAYTVSECNAPECYSFAAYPR